VEVVDLITRLSSVSPVGPAVQQLEVLLRTAILKPAAGNVGWLLRQAADRLEPAYQSRSGEHRKGRATLQVQCLFGYLDLGHDY
jgi:hypothetical protein